MQKSSALNFHRFLPLRKATALRDHAKGAMTDVGCCLRSDNTLVGPLSWANPPRPLADGRTAREPNRASNASLSYHQNRRSAPPARERPSELATAPDRPGDRAAP